MHPFWSDIRKIALTTDLPGSCPLHCAVHTSKDKKWYIWSQISARFEKTHYINGPYILCVCNNSDKKNTGMCKLSPKKNMLYLMHMLHFVTHHNSEGKFVTASNFLREKAHNVELNMAENFNGLPIDCSFD